MLSLAELRRAADVLTRRFAGYRIERCVEPGGERLAIALYGRAPGSGEGEKRIFQLSCARELARISELDALPAAPRNPPAFVSYLRAHLSRARLRSARLIGGDRQLALRFEAREGELDLVLSVFGHRSNLYVVDTEGQIVAALRPPAETRPELSLGARYVGPSGAPPREGEDRFADAADDAFLAAIEQAYSGREAEQGSEVLARELRQILKRERKSAERRLDKLEQELAEADRATDLQRHGELLKGALGRIEPGAGEIVLRDYETGEDVVIPLDPKLSPKKNLDATFKRYQKMLRRLAKAGGQIDAAREWCAHLDTLDSQLADSSEAEGAPDPAALEALAEHPEIARLLARQRSAQPGGSRPAEAEERLPARFRDLPRRLHPRRYRSRDDLEIWVGRSDEGNDYLTTRLARGNDLFFHLDGAPGSHVILRTEGRSDPPSESLLDACELAVHFSKQKNAGRADVHVVPIKQVKKPKGAKRGLVWVTGGKSIHLRREEARLERLLASRIE